MNAADWSALRGESGRLDHLRVVDKAVREISLKTSEKKLFSKYLRVVTMPYEDENMNGRLPSGGKRPAEIAGGVGGISKHGRWGSGS